MRGFGKSTPQSPQSGADASATGDETQQLSTEMLLGTATTEPVDATSSPRRRGSLSQGWGRIFRGNKVIWVMALVAVVALVTGLGLGRFIVSPGQAAADAEGPTPGLITVPVESRSLSNDVTIRGDVAYADSVEVKLETGDLGGPAVVTGQVPEVAALLDAASIALEVAGRPVVVLPGDLPVYRTLQVGVSGPDVLQLKAALTALGISPGDAASDIYDAATAAGVDALYDRIGYPAPTAGEDAQSLVDSANSAVQSARQSIVTAQAALDAAKAPPAAVEYVEQDNMVRSAQRLLAAAKAQGDGAAIADADDALKLAYARRDSALAPADTSLEQAGVTAAQQQLADAETQLAQARETTLTRLPSSEVLFMPGLPRRVDEITVSRGSIVDGPVMRVSGATLVVSASAAQADAELLTEGVRAVMAMPDDTELGATVSSVAPAETEAGQTDTTGRFTVLLTPDEMTPEQLQAIQGSNVRVTIPVSSTEGDVLAVPLAALTAGAGGESRVEISTGEGLETRLVEVSTGLAAEGFVEVSAVEEPLSAGDLVVVGR
ncbi:MAG TPA: hypothetical protein VGP24_05710 [Glaciihabitans sp.]|nr:hypothetical protein [Glaciihabitans sp.]